MILINTAVALIVFNRPETTRKVLEAIRLAAPKYLYVIADGPRKGNLNDEKQCQLVKDVIDEVDWDCEVIKNYSDINLGCGKRPASGIDWVFEQEDECIILEDDCLPTPSFFSFCENLLKKYRYDKRVMMISGNHHLLQKQDVEDSYFFSRHTQTWGWATWKRAWNYYDYDMASWPKVKKSNLLESIYNSKRCARSWTKLFDQCYQDKNKDYWDFQWTFCCLAQNALNIIPDRNLVSNIGFGHEGGTHFAGSDAPFANLPVCEMVFPLRHPTVMVPNFKADHQIQIDVYGQISLPKRIAKKFKSIFIRKG